MQEHRNDDRKSIHVRMTHEMYDAVEVDKNKRSWMTRNDWLLEAIQEKLRSCKVWE